MIRATVYLLVFAVLAAAVAWVADHPGAVTLTWLGYRVDTDVAVLLAALALLAAVAMILLWALRLVWGTPGRMMRHRRESRRLKGYRALTQGMVAVAAGDADEARRQARRADVLLGEPPLTLLLSAQAAQLNGDEAAASKYFTAMLDRPGTRFLGLRGLIVQARKKGDTPAALDLARRARELRPNTAWVLTTLHELELRAGEWLAAADTARLATRAHAMTTAESERNRAIAFYQAGKAAEASGDKDAALRDARRAVDLDPSFTPAVVRAASLCANAGKHRRARRLIEEAWSRAPHPDLAAAYLALEDDQDPLKRLMRMQRLVSRRPADPESHLALAQAALDARLWGEARHALEALGTRADRGLTARACRLWATLEEAEHGDGAASRAWLARATTATPDPAWTCEQCGTAHAAWAPFCAHCSAYDKLHWRSPAHTPQLSSEGASTAVTAGASADARGLEAPRPAEAATDLGAAS
ncbi:MAG TPA: heme biosynthesis HemY N-terminal domain-containing protein [Alphaproteobacteria bacterium]|nr:heme biosynthesis HemY N-terminal domain-containing protein [Alphaproteobacteria bacterium]